ncbi:Fatty acid-binding protein [Blattella germanica]|nr:Fatty acid-binding protein [Blattella germanica]
MAQIIGKYQLERNENLDAYFKAVGVPFMARKMMAMATPIVEIAEQDGTWSIKTSTMVRTNELKFKPGEQYDEVMPSGDVLKNTTTIEDDKVITVSTVPDGSQTTRTYTFSENEMLLTLVHEKSGETAKRYFKRLPQ